MPDQMTDIGNLPLDPTRAAMASLGQQPSPPPVGQMQQPLAAVSAPNQQPDPSQASQGLASRIYHGILSGLGGRYEPAYSIDPNTGNIQAAQVAKTPGSQWKQIIAGALVGMGAGGSGLVRGAPALSGLGAGAMAGMQYNQQQDLLKRQQAQQNFTRNQEVMTGKIQNAHLVAQTANLRQQTFDADQKSREGLAEQGSAFAQQFTDAGASPVGQNIPESELPQFMKDNPGVGTMIPAITDVRPMLDQSGQPVMDRDGRPRLENYYTVIDSNQPVQLSSSVINSYKTVGVPGADSLTAGQRVPAQTAVALQWKYAHMFNGALSNPQNWELKEVTDTHEGSPTYGQKVWAPINKVTGTSFPTTVKSGQTAKSQGELDSRAIDIRTRMQTSPVSVTPDDKAFLAAYTQNLNAKAGPTNARQDKSQLFTEQEKGRDFLSNKVESPYQDSIEKADTIQSVVDAAKSGNMEAAALQNIEAVLGLSSVQGIKRISPSEYEAAAGAGDLITRLRGQITKATAGQPLAPKLQGDLIQLAGILRNNAYTRYLNGFKMASQRYNLADEEPEAPPQGYLLPGSVKGGTLGDGTRVFMMKNGSVVDVLGRPVNPSTGQILGGR